jgi:hypothetical protein
MSKPTDPSPQLGSGTAALAVGAVAVAAMACMFPWAAAGVALVLVCVVALLKPRSQVGCRLMRVGKATPTGSHTVQ